MKDFFNSLFKNGSGTSGKVTGKAADAGYTKEKGTAQQAANRETLASIFALSGSGSNTTGSTSSTLGVQTGTQHTGSAVGGRVTGLAADSAYTTEKKQTSQAANRQTVQNWWNNEQAKSAQDNSTNRAYTAKLTGGVNIDNSAEVMKSLHLTFGGANDNAETQYNRTLKSKMGYGRNWGNPRSSVGNAIESAVAGTAAGWLNAAGTALKSDRRSGLAVDSGNMDAKATGNEWYNRAGDYLQRDADWAQMLSQNAYLRGSRNLSNAQKLLFDAGIAGTQMASDVALGTLTGGSAAIPMAIRSFGSAAQQARQDGASENQQIAYGTASALKEALTEKAFNGLVGVYGKGKADDLVDVLVRNLAKSDGGQAVARGVLNMGGERLEEITGGLIEPALQSIYNGKTLGENYRELNMADLRHEGDVAILLSGFGGSVEIASAGSGQVRSYADVLRKILPEQNTDALGTNANSRDARYQELEKKFFDGSISEPEFEELRRLENVWGQDSIGISEQAWKDLQMKKHVQAGGVTDQERMRWKQPLEKVIGGGIIEGTKSGALNPDSGEAQSHAERYYNFARKMTTDVEKIAKNTGFAVSDIQNIKSFVFYEEHELSGTIKRFDPSYEMAESWQRLVEGKGIMPHDITLLHHELMERSLMLQGVSQAEAHIITSERYDYGREARLYHDQIERYKK